MARTVPAAPGAGPAHGPRPAAGPFGPGSGHGGGGRARIPAPLARDRRVEGELVRVRVLSVLALLVTALVASAAPSLAACAVPLLDVAPTPVAPGDTVRLTGTGYAECIDLVVDGQPVGEPGPLTGMEVVLEVGGTSSVLGAVAAVGDDGVLDVEVAVPADTPTGPATIRVGPGEQAALEVVAPASLPSPTDAASDTTPDEGEQLPHTGAPVDPWWVLAALGCLTVGVGLVRRATR